MSRQWMILFIIILIYLPVSIDATVLHVAIPSMTSALALNNQQMLWIIDIYSLVMAGLILPMGALGDRIGFKRLMLIGASIFAIASTAAAVAQSAAMLIAMRALLALGAAMIIPATLAALRHGFTDEKQRNFALGIWGTVGGGGAAIGPLVGGYILEHYHWGMVFLINVPIIACALLFILLYVPKQATQAEQSINLWQALQLITAILLIIYALKSLFYNATLSAWSALFAGSAILMWFIRQQLKSTRPLIDFKLFQHPAIAVSIALAIFAMVSLVGFELLLSQELQFIYGYSPLDAGLYILPFIIAISFGGPFVSFLLNHFGLKRVSSCGLLLCALSFFGLSQINFAIDHYLAWTWMVLLGLSVEITLLSSTAAIMSTAPKHKATAAGAIEGMAYELGAGLGIAIFGMLISLFYMQHLQSIPQLSSADLTSLGHSIGETLAALQQFSPESATVIQQQATQAFQYAHRWVLIIAGSLFIILAIFVWRLMPQRVQQQDGP
ncbi:MFS transporter [Acinetobacter larvae]|uniref:MFS transporter n=1 Tax=Acinetobacter larvae TaxID=1789224 RepID=A0A1B2M0T0_9GAMM|nr:MFS transporter [Acinetobacter larvae]AOA58771.1 MFS transporter [Acinetobacter larvae]